MIKKTKGRFSCSAVIACLLVSIACVCFFAAKWYLDTYGRVGFDAILFTLQANLNGVQSGLIRSYLLKGLLPALLFSAALCTLLLAHPGKRLMLIFRKRCFRLYPLSNAASVVLSLVFFLAVMSYTAVWVELADYIAYSLDKTTLFEEEYRDPAETDITFPENKRNLVYIFLESMETSFQSYDEGGLNDVNLIPELTQLARENISFSRTDQIAGFFVTPGNSWTIGAMVGQTAGIPLRVPPGLSNNDYGDEGVFYPGLTTLGDILHDNGYYQALMVGSDAAFGGRKTYYQQHGTDLIYDLFTAREDGIVPQDYHVWWGMEDLHLYEYAKQTLPELAAREEPFAFTMLTVDTHHVDGYRCSACGTAHAEQYENVISCASRQLSDFIQWLQQQDFYEDTTIVICGDHLSMDGEYFARNHYDLNWRRGYNCFLNSAVTTEYSKNRDCTTLDLFPTVLAAMGCRIQGDRLGLGVNLFSGTPTLLERMGYTDLITELSKSSDYYTDHFFFTD